MSTNEELIAEAREVLSRPIRGDHENEQARGVITRLASALEKVTAERDGLSSLREQMSLRLRYVEGKREQAEAERDGLAAVVEQVRDTLEHYHGQKVDVAPIDILDMHSAPSVALDRVKAEAWEEGHKAMSLGQIENPYRKGESNV